MASPFLHGANSAVFDAMLGLRSKNWTRIHGNMLARRRYHERKRDAQLTLSS